MRVKGRPAHICQIDNLLNRNFRVVFFFQKLRECPEYRLSAFSLPAVHRRHPEQFLLFCSVSNESGYLIIADTAMGVYNRLERCVR